MTVLSLQLGKFQCNVSETQHGFMALSMEQHMIVASIL